jgi:cytochrome c-type biogenesis protein CcmF
MYILIGSSPFFKQEQCTVLPYDWSTGLGLNPNLHDLALSIHPPFLFLGFGLVGSLWSVCASYLFYRSEGLVLDVRSEMKRLIGVIWSIMTLGLVWGSWWAYTELGWGSFWFWDPVENVGLLPWILVTMLLHVFYGGGKGSLERGMVYGMMIYPSLLFGTWCVRSGLFTSLHSFALNPFRASFLLGILIFFILLTMFLIYKSRMDLWSVRLEKVIKRRAFRIGFFLFLWILLGTCLPFLMPFDLHFGSLFYNPWVMGGFLYILLFFLISIKKENQK